MIIDAAKLKPGERFVLAQKLQNGLVIDFANKYQAVCVECDHVKAFNVRNQSVVEINLNQKVQVKS